MCVAGDITVSECVCSQLKLVKAMRQPMMLLMIHMSTGSSIQIIRLFSKNATSSSSSFSLHVYCSLMLRHSEFHLPWIHIKAVEAMESLLYVLGLLASSSLQSFLVWEMCQMVQNKFNWLWSVSHRVHLHMNNWAILPWAAQLLYQMKYLNFCNKVNSVCQL